MEEQTVDSSDRRAFKRHLNRKTKNDGRNERTSHSGQIEAWKRQYGEIMALKVDGRAAI